MQVTNRAANVTARSFTVVRDFFSPTLTLTAVVQGGDALVTWNVEDSGSGVDASTCRLEVRQDEGAWQPFSTACAGDDTYDAEPGHTYTFRLSAADNVSNADSREVQAVVPYVKKYYYANGQRVALWQGDVVYYIHSDHLGSTNLTTDQSQQVVARQLYHPYGSPRWSQGTLPTDYTFTGQRDEAGLGLMHYGARFYSPRLGRFVSADSIVPEHGDRQAAQWPLRVGVFKPQDIANVREENRQIAQYGFWFQREPEARQETAHPTGPTNPQELNRYAYCLGNPLRYVDPEGEQWQVVFAIIALTVMIGPEVVLFGAAIVEGIRKAFSPDATPEPSPTPTPSREWGIGDITCSFCPTPVIPLKLEPPSTPEPSIRSMPTPEPTATPWWALETIQYRNEQMNPDEATQLTDAAGNPYGQECRPPWPGGPELQIFDLRTGVTRWR